MAAFATFKGTERFKKACFRHKEKTPRNKFSAHKNSESSLIWWDLKSLRWENSYDPCPVYCRVSTAKLAVLHGSNATWFQTSRYCRGKVEFIRSIELGTAVARRLRALVSNSLFPSHHMITVACVQTSPNKEMWQRNKRKWEMSARRLQLTNIRI